MSLFRPVAFRSYPAMMGAAIARAKNDEKGLGTVAEIFFIYGRTRSFTVQYDARFKARYHYVNAELVNKKQFRRVWGRTIRAAFTKENQNDNV